MEVGRIAGGDSPPAGDRRSFLLALLVVQMEAGGLAGDDKVFGRGMEWVVLGQIIHKNTNEKFFHRCVDFW